MKVPLLSLIVSLAFASFDGINTRNPELTLRASGLPP